MALAKAADTLKRGNLGTLDPHPVAGREEAEGRTETLQAYGERR